MPTPPIDPLQESTSLALKDYLSAHPVRFPISSFNLLRQLLANTPSQTQVWLPRLKLSDLSKFETMLEHWSDKWEFGQVAVARSPQSQFGPSTTAFGAGELTVVGAQVLDGASRKRKRGEEDVKSGVLGFSVLGIVLMHEFSGTAAD
jgi:hypothetical protein